MKTSLRYEGPSFRPVPFERRLHHTTLYHITSHYVTFYTLHFDTLSFFLKFFPKISQNSNLSFSQSNYFIDISIDLSIFFHIFFAISSSPGRGTSRPLGGAETAAALAADFGADGAATARPGGGAAAATALRGQAAGGAARTFWDRVWRCFWGAWDGDFWKNKSIYKKNGWKNRGGK